MAGEAKPRRYGVWAGFPVGHPEDPKRCVENLHDRFHPGGYQCTRPRGHGPEGRYCKQHDPAAVAARSKARNDAYNAKWRARDERADAERRRAAFAKAAETALRLIADGHNDARTLALDTLAMLATKEPRDA